MDSGPSEVWYGRYKAADGFRRVALCSDKTASKQMLAKLVTDAKMAQLGMVDAFEEQRKRPLAEHLADFEAALLNRGNTDYHVKKTASLAGKVIDGCGFRFISDLSASRVQSFLAELRRQEGKSVSTSNHYLRAVKSFAAWLIKDRRTADNPLAHLAAGNANLDKRHARRALPPAELHAVLQAARTSAGVFRDLAGVDRLMLYATAMGTGFRVSELASLLPSSFALDGMPPMATVDAAYAKNRKTAVQPLPPDLAEALAEYLAGKPADRPIWPGTWVEKAAVMIRRDLKAAGIPYRDDTGRVADFHCLRHSYISLLAKSGVSPKLAQELARHSDIRLTMNVYTHAGLYDLAAAVDSMPALLPPPGKHAGRHGDRRRPDRA